MKVPRGVRNNNPGNLRRGAKWQGLSSHQADVDFCVFDEPKWGIRALMKVLQSYSHLYHLDTVREIISRWAPPNENDTLSYIKSVALWVKVNPDSPLDLNDKNTLIRLAQAITKHENGQPPEEMPDAWFTDQMYSDAADLVLNKGETK